MPTTEVLIIATLLFVSFTVLVVLGITGHLDAWLP